MAQITRQHVSHAVAQLIPQIISGIQLDFLAQREVTQRQMVLLIAIHTQGRCTMSTLARRLHVSMPTVTGLIDRLTNAGYVRRVSEPEDRRHVVVTLTAKGQDFIRQFQEAIRRRWDDVLHPLDTRELESFHHVVTKLSSRLQAHR